MYTYCELVHENIYILFTLRKALLSCARKEAGCLVTEHCNLHCRRQLLTESQTTECPRQLADSQPWVLGALLIGQIN